jgi:hypothetical protein
MLLMYIMFVGFGFCYCAGFLYVTSCQPVCVLLVVGCDAVGIVLVDCGSDCIICSAVWCVVVVGCVVGGCVCVLVGLFVLCVVCGWCGG